MEIPKKMQITAPWVLENCPQIHQFMKIADKRSGDFFIYLYQDYLLDGSRTIFVPVNFNSSR